MEDTYEFMSGAPYYWFVIGVLVALLPSIILLLLMWRDPS